MSEPKIDIILSMEASRAQQTVQEFAQQSADALNRTFAGATERAEAKINELAEAQKRLGAVINENTARMEQLRQTSEKASTGEKQLIEQEIEALNRLNTAHFAELRAIEEKRVRLEAKGAIAAATTDAEKLAIQLITQNRLIELQALRDTIRAQQAVNDVATSSAAQQQAANEMLSRQQTNILGILQTHRVRLAEIAQQQQAASGSSAHALAVEAEGLRKAIATRQIELDEITAKKLKVQEAAAIQQSVTDAEKDQIRALTDEKVQGLQLDRDQARIAESVRKADSANATASANDAARRSASLDALNSKELEHRSIIDQESRDLDVLRGRRETATGEDLRHLNQQTAMLRNLIETHRQEIYEIEQKRVKNWKKKTHSPTQHPRRKSRPSNSPPAND